MRWVTFVLVFISLVLSRNMVVPDQIAVTQDGKKVLLKDNGTWEYIENNKEKSKTKTLVKEGEEPLKSPWELYSYLKRYGGERKIQEWNKFKGKYVTWEAQRIHGWIFGAPVITNDGILITLLQEVGGGYIKIEIYFRGEEEEKVFNIKEGDTVLFRGKLDNMLTYFGRDYDFKVIDAQIIKITGGTPIPEIQRIDIGYHSGESGEWVKFSDWKVFVENRGYVPMEGYKLIVKIGDIVCEKEIKNILARSAEIISLVDVFRNTFDAKCTKSGKHLTSLPVTIPAGEYVVKVFIKDPKGKIVSEREFKKVLKTGY